MVELKVTSKTYNCSLNLERRITYIRGNSGVGKSTLVEKILQYNDGDNSIKVECPRGISVLTEVPSEEAIKGYRGRVLFFDDLLATELRMGNEIVKLAVECDIYLVIINRVDCIDVGIDYSVSSILIAKCDGINHWFVSVVDDYMNDTVENRDFGVTIDCIVTEDYHGSNDFSKGLFNLPVVNAEGKNDVISKVLRMKNKGFKNIFVFVDMANFGRNFGKFFETFNDMSGVTVSFDPDYECFEYLLLMSNMFHKDFQFSAAKANSYKSWESYFEDELTKLSQIKGSRCRYSHGKVVSECYFRDCGTGSCNEYVTEKCEKFISGDKILNMFRDTIFSYILDMKEKYGK